MLVLMVMPGGLRGPKEGEEGSSIYSSGRMVGCVIGKGVNICLNLLRHLGGPNFVLSCAPMVAFTILVAVCVVLTGR